MLEIPTTRERKFALKEPKSSNNNFEKLLIETIDRELASMGDSGKEAIYFYLKSVFEIEKHEIPDKIEAFTGSLEEIFGASVKPIEISIIEARHERVYEFKYSPKQEVSYSPRTSLLYVVSCVVLCGVFRELQQVAVYVFNSSLVTRLLLPPDGQVAYTPGICPCI